MNGAIGYTNALTKYVVEQTAQKPMVKQQLEDKQHDVITGLPFKETDKILSADEIKKAVQDYCAGIDQAKKAELYIGAGAQQCQLGYRCGGKTGFRDRRAAQRRIA